MAFKVERGLIISAGTELRSRHAHALGSYTFTIDFPNYDWSSDMHLGNELAEWVAAQIDKIDDVLRDDAEKADLYLGMLRNGASWEIVGPGSRELNEETGEPIWNEVSRQFSANVRTYPKAIEEVLSKVRAYGEGKVYQGEGKPETKPFYLLMRQFVWRVVSIDIAKFPTAHDIFMTEEEKRRRRIFKKRIETMEKNKRQKSAKKGWNTRRRRKRIAKLIEAENERGFIEAMYQEFKRLREEYEKGKRRREKSKKADSKRRKVSERKKPKKPAPKRNAPAKSISKKAKRRSKR